MTEGAIRLATAEIFAEDVAVKRRGIRHAGVDNREGVAEPRRRDHADTASRQIDST